MEYVGEAFKMLESFSWIGESTNFVKLDYVDSQIAPLANSLGMQLALLKYTIGLFISIPFGAILRSIPNTNIKHFFSMIGGIFLVQWIFGADWIHTLISSAVTYLLCALAPKKYVHIIVFFWAMSYMTVAHAYRMYVSYLSGVFDFTGTQMVLTMKLTSFAYNLYDGTYDKARVFGSHDDKKKARIYSDRKKFALQSLPNPLEFFGYIYCFTCILAGPAFEYSDYVAGIDGSKFKREVKTAKTQGHPSSILPALHRLLVGVVAMVTHLAFTAYFPLSTCYSPAFIAAHDPFYRFGYTMLSLIGDRTKYYFAWKIAESASIMAGFGFEGYDKDGNVIGWRGVENIDIVTFECSSSVQILSRAWNKRTQGWLERYTYHRAGGSLFVVYFVSAIWHGLYPGFFLFFLSIPLLTLIERLAKTKINPLVIPGYDGFRNETAPKTIVSVLYWNVCRVFTKIGASYIVQVFNYSSWERSVAVWGSYYHIPHAIFALLIVLLTVLPTPQSAKKKAA